MSNPNRTFAFLPEHNLAVGMDATPNGDQTLVTLAVAFCRDSGKRRDPFQQITAQSILNTRLGSPAAGDRGLRRQFIYKGKRPRADLFYPLLDAFRKNVEERVEIVLKNLTEFKTPIVVRGIVTEKTQATITLRTERGEVVVNRHDIQNVVHVRTRRNVAKLQSILTDAPAPNELVVAL